MSYKHTHQHQHTNSPMPVPFKKPHPTHQIKLNVVFLNLSVSVQDGICALRKVHVCSTPSLRRFPNVAFEMVQMFI